MRRQIIQQPFQVPEFNTAYEGAYDNHAMRWLEVCALDKAANLAFLLQGADVNSVLEVGCGTGAVLAAVAKAGVGRTHAGIDLADPGLHRHPTAVGVDLLSYDGSHLPYEDGSVDLVFASHVLEHVPDPRSILAEIARVSARWIYLEVPCELHMRTNRRDMQQSLDIGHINSYTPDSFRLLVETSGLPAKYVGLFDHSLAVHSFSAGRLKGVTKSLLRRGLLAINPHLACRMFTYHAGILVEKQH